jgi:hypothetical protein
MFFVIYIIFAIPYILNKKSIYNNIKLILYNTCKYFYTSILLLIIKTKYFR